MQKIVVAGGAGFIGRQLCKRLLKDGYEVLVLTRSSRDEGTANGSLRYVQWDARTPGRWIESLDGAFAVVNLTGESIGAKPWSERQKEKIVTSRLDSTSAIVNALSQLRIKPTVLVNGSAVGFYGNTGDSEITEVSEKGSGFLADTVDRWEREARGVEPLGIRLVLLRTGVVLGKGGSALSRMVLPFRLFAGGPLGTGRQWFPWVHIEDVVEVVLFSIQTETINGVLNVAAPHSVTMNDFCKELGRTLHRPSWVRVPGFVLRWVLGEMSEIILGGQKVIPYRLHRAGFRFHYPELRNALASILSRGSG